MRLNIEQLVRRWGTGGSALVVRANRSFCTRSICTCRQFPVVVDRRRHSKPFISICNQAKVSLHKCQTLTRLFVFGNCAQNLFIICLFCGISRCGLSTLTQFCATFCYSSKPIIHKGGPPWLCLYAAKANQSVDKFDEHLRRLFRSSSVCLFCSGNVCSHRTVC